jgi:hypothetical protein
MTLRPAIDGMTGHPSNSASPSNAAFAPARSTPVPAKITGDLAAASSSAALASCASDGCGSEARPLALG